jgi:hypothetical protein
MLQISRLTDDRILYFDGAMGTMLQSMGHIGLPFPKASNLTLPRSSGRFTKPTAGRLRHCQKPTPSAPTALKRRVAPYDADEAVAAVWYWPVQAADAFSASGHKRLWRWISVPGQAAQPLGHAGFRGRGVGFRPDGPESASRTALILSSLRP